MYSPVIHEAEIYRLLHEQLVAEFPDADDETLRDTLEGLSSLPEVLAALVRSYLDDLSVAAALGMRMSDMQERLGRFEARAENSQRRGKAWRSR